MKECFGISFGFFEQGMSGKYEERKKCYDCPDYDKCFEMSLIQAIYSVKLEIRAGVRGVRNSLGGSHSEIPFW